MTLRELSDGGKYLSPLMQSISPLVQQIISSVFKQAPGIRETHLILNMMSMIWGTFLLQPMYTKILPLAGISLTLDDEYFAERVRSIVAMVVQSQGLKEGTSS